MSGHSQVHPDSFCQGESIVWFTISGLTRGAFLVLQESGLWQYSCKSSFVVFKLHLLSLRSIMWMIGPGGIYIKIKTVKLKFNHRCSTCTTISLHSWCFFLFLFFFFFFFFCYRSELWKHPTCFKKKKIENSGP